MLILIPPLPPELSIFLAAFAAWLSNYLRDDKLPRQQNILIALAGFIVCVIAACWLTVGFTSDIKSDALLLVAMIVQFGLGGKELNDLLNYIKSVPSPLASPAVTTVMKIPANPQQEQVL
jgi:hypothetical protein